MAFAGCGSLGLLAWLLLLQLWLGEAQAPWAGAGASSPSLPSGVGREDPGVSWWESLALEVPGPPARPDSMAFTPGDSYNAHAKRRDTASAGDSTPGTMISGCGHRSLRIVGGAPAPERKWPWQVSLQVNDKHVCGGSLIAHQWVLTAGHCIFGFMEYTVKLGDIDLNHQSNMAVVVPVRDIVMHHDYSSRGTISDDIALALLDFPVNYSTHIQPVCLPEKTFLVPNGTTCWVTGWGKLEEEDGPDKAPKLLQEADLTIMRYKECNKLLKKLMNAKNDMVRKGAVCGYSDKGKDSCQGDSGGPLVCEYNETWIQVGIVSWGVGCGREGYPGVYTELSFYVDWVKRHMNQASCLDSTAFLVLLLCMVLPLGSLATL